MHLEPHHHDPRHHDPRHRDARHAATALCRRPRRAPALHILPYLAGIGITVGTLDDLLAINDDDTEEEFHAFPVVEGVAVVMVSDGLWLLFEPAAAP